MTHSILEKLKGNNTLISDGAWGTLLQEQGLQPGECPEEWNLTNPEKVSKVAKAYLDAGSDLVETNSFGASSFKLAHYGLQDKAVEINRRAAELSKAVAGDDKIVIGSVGPTGIILMMGEVSEEELYESFKQQVIALAEGGADAICIETMTDLAEAKQAIKAVKENTELEVICTMTFDKTVDGDFRTMMGVSVEQMTSELIEFGADIIGTNCGNGMENMISIVEAIRNINAEIPILVHANAGLILLNTFGVNKTTIS